MSGELSTLGNVVAVDQIKGRVNAIQHCMRDVMKEGTHYGKIKGCRDENVLLKPGAEMLRVMFQFGTRFDVDVKDLGDGHREYVTTCHVTNPDGTTCCDGMGSCSTMESKYRYRTGPVEYTGQPVPREYWDGRDQKVLGGKGHVAKKNPDTGLWEIAVQGSKVENPDIADVYNTVLKMSKKRAFVDGMLAATGASDMFVQDLDDELEQTAPTPDETQPPDPMDMYRDALTRAKNERGIPVEDAMAEVDRRIGKDRSEYDRADIVEACGIVDAMAASAETLDEDIPF
ncbi:hypothetical protein [Gordonibacter massiliensis (ex Traore et al. 2017)]|uniref:hypothetical protein n=1 Tax=Gordonibacter massiliensis (ex Traore et al. 2017) TaxID=1841863 RepID=UPI001C8C8FBF|nr:hypothetical protein [Gordonibacter massiliensis (ex Traore et al. 2017)]MBX9032646.1 hypothetical protein [Gordonibacter massiliensis (ex Traore et al. 2017)]